MTNKTNFKKMLLGLMGLVFCVALAAPQKASAQVVVGVGRPGVRVVLGAPAPYVYAAPAPYVYPYAYGPAYYGYGYGYRGYYGRGYYGRGYYGGRGYGHYGRR